MPIPQQLSTMPAIQASIARVVIACDKRVAKDGTLSLANCVESKALRNRLNIFYEIRRKRMSNFIPR